MFNILKKKRKDRRVVVIGLDGVPYTLLIDYMQRGIMPELSKLCKTGKLSRMKSTLPEVSSVAWTSFMTGKNPGEHGIFGFMEIDKQSYDYKFPNFSSLKAQPIWVRDDIKAVAFNIPQTYPAKEMNGVMVSGFVAIDLKKATYPDRVFDYLHGMGYRIDVNAKLATENPEAFFKDLFDTFGKRKQAIEYLYDNEEWQLFIGTITETDRLHHFFFDSAQEGQYYNIFEKYYRELDGFIGSMAKKATEDNAAFLTCSDHGFTPIKTEVYINRWLMENGYLKLDSGEGLKGVNPDTKAFCLDPSRIYIHLEGKYKRGMVKQSDCKGLVNELREQFLKLTFEGQTIIHNVFPKEDIFRGTYADEGPDLYLLPNYGFDLKGSTNKDYIFGKSHFRGMHTYDDAHLFTSTPTNGEDIEIESVAGIIVQYLQ